MSIKSQLYDFKYYDVNWGSDEGTGDRGLADYFVECPKYDQILSGEKRYIFGRKGSGKSAILEKLRLDCRDNPTLFYSDVSLRKFPLNDFKSLGDKSFQGKAKYVDIWKFLFLVEFSQLVIKDNSTLYQEYRDTLQRFINRNFPDGMGMVSTINYLKSRNNKINVPAKFLELGSEHTKSVEHSIEIHFSKATDILIEIIKKCISDSKYYVLVDELDEGYKSSDSNIRVVILSLLRACEELCTIFRNYGLPFFTIIALRSDIYYSIDDNDSNKLDDHILELNWNTYLTGEWALFRIVQERIAASFKRKFPEEEISAAWKLVISEAPEDRDLWKYMITMTFSRPRDIIKMLKYCGESNIQELNMSTIRTIEGVYSTWFYREIGNEIHSFLPCWKAALSCLTEIGKGKETVDRLEDFLQKNSEINAWLSEQHKNVGHIVNLLFEFNIIGYVDDEGQWIFHYKDIEVATGGTSVYPSYCVHYGLCHKLRIQKPDWKYYLFTYEK